MITNMFVYNWISNVLFVWMIKNQEISLIKQQLFETSKYKQ